jgi:hypothetical protein
VLLKGRGKLINFDYLIRSQSRNITGSKYIRSYRIHIMTHKSNTAYHRVISSYDVYSHVDCIDLGFEAML